MQCDVIPLSIVMVVMRSLLVPLNLVSACPARPPLVHCNDFTPDTPNNLLDWRYFAIRCLLNHVTKDQPTVDPTQLRAMEHSVVRHECGPLGPLQPYRYMARDQEPVRNTDWRFMRPLRGLTSSWRKDGKAFGYQCVRGGSCRIHVTDRHIQIADVRPTDVGTYSCVSVHSCQYDSPHAGMCKIQRGSTFRLAVTALEATSTTTRVESVTSAAPSTLRNIMSTTLTSLLGLTIAADVVVQPIIPPKKSTETDDSSTADKSMSTPSESDTPNVTKHTVLQFSASTVMYSNGASEGQETWTAVSGPEWKGNASVVEPEYDTDDMDGDQWTPLKFTYPAQCPWCTGNCPCHKKRTRKDIKI